LASTYRMTDSDDGMLSMDDDFPESDEDDDAGVDDIDDEDYIINMEQEMEAIKPKPEEEEHPYEILTGDQVVELMQDIIREVNTIVQVCCCTEYSTLSSRASARWGTFSGTLVITV